MGANALRTSALVVASALTVASSGCGRLGYELIASTEEGGALHGDGGRAGDGGSGAAAGAGGLDDDDGGAGRSNGGSSGAGNGGTGARGGSSSAGSGGMEENGAASSGGAGGSGAGGSGALDDGGSDGSLPVPDGAAPDAGTTACGPSAGALQTWPFDSQTSGWAWSPDLGAGTLTWTASTGNPAPGALALDVPSGSGRLGWVLYTFSPTDLRGQIAHAFIRLESGTDVGVKLFVQSQSYDWADGGHVLLTPGVWTCLTLDFDAPVYASAAFDASTVFHFGIEVGGTGPLSVHVDQLGY
jgi:hypothetical protein